jgi:hypothetical protein
VVKFCVGIMLFIFGADEFCIIGWLTSSFGMRV